MESCASSSRAIRLKAERSLLTLLLCLPRRMPCAEIFFRPIDFASPFQRLILIEALAELPRDFRACQLHAEIERMTAIVLDLQFGIERERIARLIP